MLREQWGARFAGGVGAVEMHACRGQMDMATAGCRVTQGWVNTVPDVAPGPR
jgi:hypothetical protein